MAAARIGRRFRLPDLADRSKFRAVDRSILRPISALQVAEDIVALRADPLRDRRRPLSITQNGKAAAVLLSPEEFDRLTTQARFVAAVQDGLADHEAGRVISHEELGRRLDARFGVIPEQKK